MIIFVNSYSKGIELKINFFYTGVGVFAYPTSDQPQWYQAVAEQKKKIKKKEKQEPYHRWSMFFENWTFAKIEENLLLVKAKKEKKVFAVTNVFFPVGKENATLVGDIKARLPLFIYEFEDIATFEETTWKIFFWSKVKEYRKFSFDPDSGLYKGVLVDIKAGFQGFV